MSLGYLLFAFALAIAGGAMALHGWRELHLHRLSRGWPTTTASIVDHEVGATPPSVTGDLPAISAARAVYEYTANGVSYRGTFDQYSVLRGSPRVIAEMIDRVPIGKSIIVSWDPQRPARSYYDRGVTDYAQLYLAPGVMLVLSSFVVMWNGL